MSRNRTELITKKQKIMNISKQLDERETMHIPLCFKYTGNPGPLSVDLGNWEFKETGPAGH